MSNLTVLGNVDAGDLAALRDLVRFGVMADDQIARRYADPASAPLRLVELKADGIISLWWEPLEGARVYSPTRLAQVVVGLRDLRPRAVYPAHLAHDVAVVDLADWLLAQGHDLEFITESEVRGYLDRVARPRARLPGDSRHRPDGLLISGGERIGIELEHSNKSPARYTTISDWFVREWRVDRVRWYIDNPKIPKRLRDVNSVHGYDHDMKIEIEPFPPGVRLRRMRGRYEP